MAAVQVGAGNRRAATKLAELVGQDVVEEVALNLVIDRAIIIRVFLVLTVYILALRVLWKLYRRVFPRD
jgi:hypothetical protein